jgi:hypothetical protein
VARAAVDELEAAIFTVAAFTGLRLGELRALLFRPCGVHETEDPRAAQPAVARRRALAEERQGAVGAPDRPGRSHWTA